MGGGRPQARRRAHRASTTTRVIGNLLRDQQSKSSWVVSMLFFARDPGYELVRDTIKTRLLAIPRFRSKLVYRRFPTRADFVELEESEIDLDYHFRTALDQDGPVEMHELNTFVGNMFDGFQHPMDKPLWQCTYVPRLTDGRACLIANISHIIGDGVSQIEVLHRLLDESPPDDASVASELAPQTKLELAPESPASTRERREPDVAAAVLLDRSASSGKAKRRPTDTRSSSIASTGSVPALVREATNLTIRESATESIPKRRRPPTIGPFTKARVFVHGVVEGAVMPFSRPDPRNTLRLKDLTRPSATKRCSLTPTIPLDRVKELKNMFDGATVNDVLVTLLTLVLKAYFVEVGDKAGLTKKVRAQFPINTRSRGEEPFRAGNPHNKFGFGFMRFHVGYKGTPIQLLWKTKRTLDKIKHSPSPLVQKKVADIVSPIMPLKMLNDTTLTLAAKATAQMSNVPGPQVPVYIAGTRIDDMRFLINAPLSFYVGLLTYNGALSASFCIDSALADPELVAKHWLPEFERFYEAASAEAKLHDGLIPRPRGCFDCL